MTETADSPKRLFKPFISGDWMEHAAMAEYRAEWFNSLLVERAAWTAQAPTVELLDTVIGGPGFVWFRFWLPDLDQLVEKYFNAEGDAIGFYLPVCRPLVREDSGYHTSDLILAIWYHADKRVSVLREEEFDEGVRRQLLSSEEAERAEIRIRELTAAIFREEFPPPLVRNFSIATEKNSSGSQ
jgi:predicted RNA-binding protein associated with RNAse of E/G family